MFGSGLGIVLRRSWVGLGANFGTHLEQVEAHFDQLGVDLTQTEAMLSHAGPNLKHLGPTTAPSLRTPAMQNTLAGKSFLVCFTIVPFSLTFMLQRAALD